MSDTSVQRAALVNRKIAEAVSEAVVAGMEPFLYVSVLRTFNDFTVWSAGDCRVVLDVEELDLILVKIKNLVGDYCLKLSGVRVVAGSGSS